MNIHYDFPSYELSAVEAILSRTDTPSLVNYSGGSCTGEVTVYSRDDSSPVTACSIRDFWFLVNTYGIPHKAVT